MKNKFKISVIKAFTLIETLVAVAILMISIAGPLTIAQKGLLAAVYARDQAVASFLAQDVMEYTKSVRDYNYRNSGDWLSGIRDCTVSVPCGIDTLTGDPSSTARILGSSHCTSNKGVDAEACPLFTTDSGYTPESSGGRQTQFYRLFYLTVDPANENKAKFFSIVSWKNGNVENQVRYQNELYNIRM